MRQVPEPQGSGQRHGVGPMGPRPLRAPHTWRATAYLERAPQCGAAGL